MKRSCFMLMLAALLLTGCADSKPDNTIPAESHIMTESTTVLATEPDQQLYSQEQAMIDGCLVIVDGDVRHNQRNWFDFLEITEAGAASAFTVMHYFYGENGIEQIRYDLSFDGAQYQVQYQNNGNTVVESASEIAFSAGDLYDTMEPYDKFESYSMNELVIYQDLIAEPDFNGVTKISLHAKEGEPPVQVYTEDSVNAILSLLSNGEYLPCEPLDYLYCMKLIMTNGEGNELIIELDYRYGNFRYGTQTYQYGLRNDLFSVLGIDAWPESVIEEFDAYLNGEFQENLNS